MDLRSMLLTLNGCENEIHKLEAPMENFQGLTEADVDKLRAYNTRKSDLLETLSSMGYEAICVRGKWFISPRRSVEGIDVLAPC